MLFVAELGLNHDGNFDLAYEMIRRAKAADADVAKFQFGWRDKPDEINCIDKERAKQLRSWCDFHEIEMLASVIKPEAFELAQAAGVSRYKVASRTVVDYPDLIRNLIDTGKEVFVSLGFWEGDDWPFGPPTDKLRYIFCRSKYPSYPQDMIGMPERFADDGYYGYSCHYHGPAAVLTAAARGARFIEKHFTLNKSSQVIRDHTLSATPEEFAEMVRLGREVGRLNRVIDGGAA